MNQPYCKKKGCYKRGKKEWSGFFCCESHMYDWLDDTKPILMALAKLISGRLAEEVINLLYTKETD